MKAKITVTSTGHVILERDDSFTGERKSTEYFAPRPNGYVRIADDQQRFPQVCYGLYGTGDTLWSSPENLPALIRREWRRRRNAEKRENEKY